MAKNIISKIKKSILERLSFKYKSENESEPEAVQILIDKKLTENKKIINDAMGMSPDLVFRSILLGADTSRKLLAVFIDGLVDKNLVNESIIKPLNILSGLPYKNSIFTNNLDDLFNVIKEQLVTINSLQDITQISEVFRHLCSGKCVVFLDGIEKALVCEVQGWEKRGIEEPVTEPSIRGPREGFVENFRTNTSLIRRRIKDPRLWVEELVVGKVTHTKIGITYIKGLAKDSVVEEVKNRIKKIDIDSIQESGQLEELIEDAPLSPFPTMLRTERPDRVTGALLEGRVAIVTEGTPFVLVVPSTFTMFLSANEDYYERFYIGSALRLLRFMAFFMSLTLPSLYVAITTFHQEMLPTPLVLRIAAQREGVPFPAVLEALLMELAFEILREAGIRLPKVIGPAISIVGALILGQSAVQAGLVSAVMIIVVATTAIASFTTPVYSMAIGVRFLRFPIIILAGTLGLFGIFWALFAILIHLTALRSFGVPFLEPLSPIVIPDLKDALIRSPWWAMKTRPEYTGANDEIREETGLRPKPPKQSKTRNPRERGKKNE